MAETENNEIRKGFNPKRMVEERTSEELFDARRLINANNMEWKSMSASRLVQVRNEAKDSKTQDESE